MPVNKIIRPTDWRVRSVVVLVIVLSAAVVVIVVVIIVVIVVEVRTLVLSSILISHPKSSISASTYFNSSRDNDQCVW